MTNIPDPAELQARLEFALDASADAEEFILTHYMSQDLKVDRKADDSPVTIADRGAEERLRGRITAANPDDGILGEEYGETASKNGWRWLLDPVDGTKSFMHGVPLFGTLIGLEYNSECVLGIARFPGLEEVVYATRGEGTWWERRGKPKRRCKVTTTPKLNEALFCTTTITGWDKIGRVETFKALCEGSRLARGWGDCYGHVLVATGRADVMVDPELSPWDAAALIPIVQEAGGSFLDWNGNVSLETGNGFSVNSALRDEVLAILGGES